MLEQHYTNRLQNTNRLPWPVIVILGIVCVYGLILIAAAYTGFMNGYNGARYRSARMRGNDFYARGDYARAADEYAKMIAAKPDAANGYRLHGDAEYEIGTYSSAIADYNHALQHTQGAPASYLSHVYYDRGIAYAACGDYARAVADDTTALRLDFADTEVLRVRAEAYADMQDFPHAIHDANAVIAPRPMGSAGYLLRAHIWQTAGDHARAAADYRRAIRLSPENTDAYDALAQMYDTDQKEVEAVQVTQAEVQALPGSATCWGTLGWLQYRAGDYGAAITSDCHARRLDDSLSYIGLNLGLCYAVSGDWPMAQQTYANVLPHCRPEDMRSGANDLREARKKHPGEASVLRALAMMSAR